MAGVRPPTAATRRKLTMLTVCAGAFMATLDTSMVSISLPLMARELQASLPAISWVMMAYLIVNASLLLSSSQLGDLWPTGRLFVAGMLIFCLAAAICGWLTQLWQLFLARAGQGLGAALMLGVAPKIITLIFPEGERGLPFGLFSTAFASGVTVGAPLGGLIAAHWGWPWIFLINLPIGGLALLVGGRQLFGLRADTAGLKGQVDWCGGLFFTLSIALLMWALMRVRTQGWQHPVVWVALGGAALALATMLLVERRQPRPLLAGVLWRRWAFSLGAMAVVLTFAPVMGTFFLLPFYLEEIFHLPTQKIGWLLAVLSLANGLISPLGGLYGDRWSNLAVLRIGALLILAGLGALWWLGPAASVSQLALLFAVTGMGFGLFQAPNLNEMLRGMPSQVLGLAAGTNALLKNIGSLLGIALMVTVASWGEGEPTPLRPGYCLGWGCFASAFLTAISLAALNLGLNLLPRGRLGGRRRHSDQVRGEQ